MNKEEVEALEKRCKKMVSDFMEHHANANIRIFVTLTDKGVSSAYDTGGGDWYSTYGYISDWVRVQGARACKNGERADTDDEKDEPPF